MPVCTKCGAETAEDAAFCKSCGSGLGGRGASPVNRETVRVTAWEKKGLKYAGAAAGAVAVILAVVALSIVFLGRPDKDGLLPHASGAHAVTSFTAVGQVNGEVHIPLNSLVEGKAHFFIYRNGRTVASFFVLRRSDGSFGAALDACTSCYRAGLGFRQDGDRIICNDCGMAFRPEDVGVITGGCSPIPLEAAPRGSDLVIKAALLENAGKYF